NHLLAGFTARGSKLSQSHGVALASNNRAHNRHTSPTGDVGQYLAQLDVHHFECLLHLVDVGRTMLNHLGAIAHERAERDDLSIRTKGSLEQAKSVELLQPLGIIPV